MRADEEEEADPVDELDLLYTQKAMGIDWYVLSAALNMSVAATMPIE